MILPESNLHSIFDSHAHYFDARFDAESEGADAILSQIIPTPVSHILNVGTNPETSQKAVSQAAKYAGMYAAVGIHPEDCHACDFEDSMAWLRAVLSDADAQKRNKIVALGEIGLDYHTEFFGSYPLDKAREMRFFEAQLDLAEALDLPVIIHDRDAHGDCFETVLRHPKARGVFHSFSGSAELAKELVRRGWYLSFSGTITFKNAPRVREAALAVPRDRLLIETDCPYLAPHPYRGQLNHSGLLVSTASALAELWGCEVQEAVNQTSNNAKMLFLRP